MCIVVINNAQISIQFSRKASESPSVVDGTDVRSTYLGPMPFCELVSKTAWEGTRKPRQRTDGAFVRLLTALLSPVLSLLSYHE